MKRWIRERQKATQLFNWKSGFKLCLQCNSWQERKEKKTEKKNKMVWCCVSWAGKPTWPDRRADPPDFAKRGPRCSVYTSNFSLKVKRKPRTEIAIHWEEKAEGVFWASSKIIRLRGNYFDFVKSEWTAKGSRHRILSEVNPPARSVLSYCRVRGA